MRNRPVHQANFEKLFFLTPCITTDFLILQFRNCMRLTFTIFS